MSYFTWTQRSTGFDVAGAAARACCYAQGAFFVVGQDGTPQALVGRSADGGVTWSYYLAPFSGSGNAPQYASGIAYSPELGLFVATVINNTGITNAIYSSSDGIVWTARGNPFTSSTGATGVAWSPSLGMFIVTGAGTNDVLARSTNGTSWTIATTPWAPTASARATEGVAWSQTLGLWVAVGLNFGAPTRQILTSPDGITWTVQHSPYDGLAQFYFAACDFPLHGMALIGGESGSASVASSSDGLAWVGRSSNPSTTHAVCDANGYALAVGTGSPPAWSSPDAVTWSAESASLGSGGFALGCCWSPGISMAMIVGSAVAPATSVLTGVPPQGKIIFGFNEFRVGET